MAKVFLFLLIALIGLKSWGQTTYTWTGSSSTSWETAANWSPSRISPAPNDILVFSSNATVVLDFVTTQSIGKLQISGASTNVIFQANSNVTLNMGASGITNPAFLLANGNTLTLQSNTNTVGIGLMILTGFTGSVFGDIVLGSGAKTSQSHKIMAADANGLIFENGATCATFQSSTGNPFGSTIASSVIFASGSTFIFKGGANPFSLAQPKSIVVFQVGSLYKHSSTRAPAISGRTYGNFEYATSAAISSTGSAKFVCDNLTISSGTFNLNTTSNPGHTIKGNIHVATGATFSIAGASNATFNIGGSSNQTFTGKGSFNIGGGAGKIILNISNTSGFSVSGNLNINSTGFITTGGYLTIAPEGAIKGILSNISGSVTLQQSIIAQRGWRMFANPFTTTQTFASLSTNNNITIQTTGSNNISGIADARIWNNSSNAWADAGASTAANTPYSLFIRGIKTDISSGGTGINYIAGPTAFTYSVSGILNTSNYTVPAPSNAANFSIIGNPFAAPVNSSELTNGTGVPYYIYQISVSGNGRTKNGGWSSVLSSSATTPIPVFGVIAWKPSSSYTIQTSGINTTNAPTTGLFDLEPVLQYVELQIEQNGNYQDKYYLRLDSVATAKGNDKLDLEKFYNENVNLYSITTDKSRLAIDSRNVLNNIPLGISAVAGDYNFKLANNSLPEGTTVILNDKYLNTQTALQVGNVYPFSITSEASTKGEQRFELLFSSKKAIPSVDQNGSLTAEVLGNIISGNQIAVRIGGAITAVTIRMNDMFGKVLGTINATNGIQYLNVGNASKGMLILQISDGKNLIIKKVLKLK